jgi:hypothetical protein
MFSFDEFDEFSEIQTQNDNDKENKPCSNTPLISLGMFTNSAATSIDGDERLTTMSELSTFSPKKVKVDQATSPIVWPAQSFMADNPENSRQSSKLPYADPYKYGSPLKYTTNTQHSPDSEIVVWEDEGSPPHEQRTREENKPPIRRARFPHQLFKFYPKKPDTPNTAKRKRAEHEEIQSAKIKALEETWRELLNHI